MNRAMTQKEEPVVVVSKKNFFHKNLRWLIPLIVVVIAVGIIAIVININSNKNNQNVCSNSIINQAYSNFSPNNINSLSTTVSTITKLKNYQKDPNCMYILTIYYINIANPTKAQNSLNTVIKDKTIKLDQLLLKHSSLSKLNQTISYLKKDLQTINQNSANLSPPPLNITKAK